MEATTLKSRLWDVLTPNHSRDIFRKFWRNILVHQKAMGAHDRVLGDHTRTLGADGRALGAHDRALGAHGRGVSAYGRVLLASLALMVASLALMDASMSFMDHQKSGQNPGFHWFLLRNRDSHQRKCDFEFETHLSEWGNWHNRHDFRVWEWGIGWISRDFFVEVLYGPFSQKICKIFEKIFFEKKMFFARKLVDKHFWPRKSFPGWKNGINLG